MASSSTALILSPLSTPTAQYMVVWGALVLLMVICALALTTQYCKLWLHPWLNMRGLSDLLFSKDPKQRTLGWRFLVGAVNSLVGVGALNYGAVVGVIDPAECSALTWAALTTIGVFYLVMRLGWNQRLAQPAMTEPQMLSTTFFLAWGYLIGGPGSPVALILLLIILMFGLFTSPFWQLIRTVGFAALAFCFVFIKVAMDHSNDDHLVKMQVVYFSVLLISLLSVCLLVTHMAKLRAKLTQQKNDLIEALKQIKELAIRDELTGLFNRRHMLAALDLEAQRIERNHGRCCLAVIDVDHFKRVNDQLGHGAGDEVLRSMAQVIAAGLREVDVVARWGGEEFLILFTDTDCDVAGQVLTRIRQTLEHTVVSESTPDLRVTFSAGMCSHLKKDTISATIEYADQALYKAKAAGRNITVCHPLCQGH